jgi:hypothetical protein
MDMAQMMERLLAKLDTDKKKMLAEIKADRKTDTERMIARMDAKMGSMQTELKSAIKDLKFNREETMACQEIMEARLEVEDRPASVDTTPEAAHEQEVPREDAEVMPVGEPRKRRQDRRHLAAMCR